MAKNNDEKKDKEKKEPLMVSRLYVRDHKKGEIRFLTKTFEEMHPTQVHTKSEWDNVFNTFMNKRVH